MQEFPPPVINLDTGAIGAAIAQAMPAPLPQIARGPTANEPELFDGKMENCQVIHKELPDLRGDQACAIPHPACTHYVGAVIHDQRKCRHMEGEHLRLIRR